MKSTLFLLTAFNLLLVNKLAIAQTYNAGIGSGTGGTAGVYVGTSAGRITTGTSNSFVGFQSGFNNTDGSFNSFLGTQAGYSNSTGTNNSFLGFQAGVNNSTGTFN